jgi:hypothetical protein
VARAAEPSDRSSSEPSQQSKAGRLYYHQLVQCKAKNQRRRDQAQKAHSFPPSPPPRRRPAPPPPSRHGGAVPRGLLLDPAAADAAVEAAGGEGDGVVAVRPRRAGAQGPHPRRHRGLPRRPLARQGQRRRRKSSDPLAATGESCFCLLCLSEVPDETGPCFSPQGAYRDDNGKPLVLDCVREAERRIAGNLNMSVRSPPPAPCQGRTKVFEAMVRNIKCGPHL